MVSKLKKYFIFLSIILIFAFSIYSCSLYQAAQNIQKLKFRISGIDDFRLMGVSLTGKTSLKDLSLSDALKLKDLITLKSFPVQFVLNLDALNPNDGKTTPVKSDLTITKMDWRLVIDDVPTINGSINSPIAIPASGQSVTIPITMELDLIKFFTDKSYDKLVDLALALGGLNKDLTRVKLDVKPSVQSILGTLTYPSWITVINKSYSN